MTPPALAFRIEHRDGEARTGVLETAHGAVPTPAFMPVATYGAVRGVAPDELAAAGAQILLANTYHLHERPGEDVVAGLGGLHGFTGWSGPWLTDSGGFQVTSLSDKVRVDEEGVTFASPVDGRRRMLSPERVVAVQESLGSDIAMVLDECVRPDSGEPGDALRVQAATERTLRWAERSQRAHRRADQWLFGIVQGGASAAVAARQCARDARPRLPRLRARRARARRGRGAARRAGRDQPRRAAGRGAALSDGARPPGRPPARHRAGRRSVRLRAADAPRAPRRPVHEPRPRAIEERGARDARATRPIPIATARRARAIRAPICATCCARARCSVRGSPRSTTCASTCA